MSYILEALRKSEGERSTGIIPGLAAEHHRTSEGLEEDYYAPRRPLWPWVLCGVLLLNAGLLSFVFWPRSQPAEPVSGAVALLSEASPRGQLNTAAEPVQPTQPAQAPSQPAQSYAAPQQPLQPYATMQAPGYVQPLPGYGAPVYPQQPGYGPPASAYVQPFAQPGYPGQAVYGQAPVYPVQPYGAAPAYGVPAQALPGYGVMPAPGTAPGEVLPELSDGEMLITPDGAQSQDATRLPTLADLPALKAQLPPLELTTHVHSDNPANSLVVINGRTLNKGEAVLPGLTLEAIVTEGVVLNFQGQRFRIDAVAPDDDSGR